RIQLSQPSVASLDGSNVVAAVVATAYPDTSILDDLGEGVSWEQTATGVDVYEGSATAPDAPTTTVTLSSSADETARSGVGGTERGALVRSYSWAELGITPELEPYLDGRTFVYASDDGQAFDPIDIPVDGWGAAVIAAEDGYRMFVSQSDS